MSASRKRPKGALRRPFGLVMSCVIMMPNSVGHQDLASLIARQPGVAERGRQHIRSVTTLTALHAATFSFPRPLGSTIPDAPGYQLASLDPMAFDVTGAVRRRSDPFYDPFAERDRPPAPQYEFPTVDRRLKGDMLVRREQVPATPAVPQAAPSPGKKEDRLAPKISMPETTPAVSAHEPLAIPQKLIAEAARIDAQRRNARAKAEAAAREAMLAMKPEVQAEPFAIAESDIAAADRVAEERMAAERLAAERLAESKAAALAPKEQPAAAEPRKTESVPQIEVQDIQPKAEAPQPVAEAKPAPVAYPDVVAWAQPATELFAVSEDLIAESERIAVARAADAAKRTEVAALTPSASNVPEVSAGEDSAVEDSTGTPVVENDRILTDEEPGDEDTTSATPAEPDNPAMQMAKLYFGADSFGAAGSLEAYKPGEAPTLVPSSKIDPDIKLSALTQAEKDQLPDYKRGDEFEKDGVTKPGVTNETIAPKGEVTGEGKRPRTPAERLGLTGANRAKQERCLTNAIYFEARGEFERGQMAVAQVVMNRVFSPYYPLTVCGVVYQNAHKHNACQFTFACDNVRDVVTEPEAWETAKRISRDTLDGKIWLPEISKATHYHATYVSPWWKRTMNKYKTLGIHIFYRPKRWGDGSDEPTWDPAEIQATGSIKVPDKSHATAFNK